MTDADELHDALAAALTSNGLSASVTANPSGEPQVSIRLTNTTLEPIDLSSLPEGAAVRLHVKALAVQIVDIEGLPSGCDVEIELELSTSLNRFEMFRLTDCAGTIRPVPSNRPLRFAAESSTTTVVAAEGVHVVVLNGGFGGNEAGNYECDVRIQGGHLSVLWALGRVRVTGSGTIDCEEPALPSGVLATYEVAPLPGIWNVVVEEDTDLSLSSKVKVMNVRAVEGSSGRPRLVLEDPAWPKPKGGVTLGRSRGVDGFKFREVDGVEIVGDFRLEVEVGRKVTNTTFSGRTTVKLGTNAIGDDVKFSPDHDPNAELPVHLGKGAVLTRASGVMHLGKAENAFLSGANLYLQPHSEPLEPSVWQGLVLDGARLPTALRGRQMLATMADVFHLAPDVRRVPGWDQTLWRKKFWETRTWYKVPLWKRLWDRLRRTSQAEVSRGPLEQEAEFTRELARLVKEKGAPGSVITKAAWCAYRLRAIKAKGLMERFALWVYRGLGYGERPIPAFATWLVAAVVLAGPVLLLKDYHFDGSEAGFKHWSAEVGRLLLGPFAGASWGQRGALGRGEIAEVAARVLVTVPLVTGSLALRNYVKTDSK